MNCGKKLSYTCRREQLCLTLLYSGKIVLQVEIGSTFKIIIASFFHFFTSGTKNYDKTVIFLIFLLFPLFKKRCISINYSTNWNSLKNVMFR